VDSPHANEVSRQGHNPGPIREGVIVQRRIEPRRRTHCHDGDARANAERF